MNTILFVIIYHFISIELYIQCNSLYFSLISISQFDRRSSSDFSLIEFSRNIFLSFLFFYFLSMPPRTRIVASASLAKSSHGSTDGYALLTGVHDPSAPPHPSVGPALGSDERIPLVPPPMDPNVAERILTAHHVPVHPHEPHPPPYSAFDNSSVHPLAQLNSLHDSLTPQQSRAHVMETLHQLYEPQNAGQNSFKPVPPYNPDHSPYSPVEHQSNNLIQGVPPHPVTLLHSQSLNNIHSNQITNSHNSNSNSNCNHAHTHDHDHDHSHQHFPHYPSGLEAPTEFTPLIDGRAPAIGNSPASAVASFADSGVHIHVHPPSHHHNPSHCPFDYRPHEYYTNYTWWGLLCAVLCFPIGLICCCSSKKYICMKCGYKLEH